MGALLILVAPILPFVWVVKLSAALVLFVVSAASVVVALKAVPAEAVNEKKTAKRRMLIPYFGTRTPGLFRRLGERRDKPSIVKFLVLLYLDCKGV